MTGTRDTDETERTDRTDGTMAEVSHVNPHTGRPFGATAVFGRGPRIATDGGQSEGPPEDAPEAGTAPDEEGDEETMADVSHTPPNGDGANRVFERGTEGRDETV